MWSFVTHLIRSLSLLCAQGSVSIKNSQIKVLYKKRIKKNQILFIIISEKTSLEPTGFS